MAWRRGLSWGRPAGAVGGRVARPVRAGGSYPSGRRFESCLAHLSLAKPVADRPVAARDHLGSGPLQDAAHLLPADPGAETVSDAHDRERMGGATQRAKHLILERGAVAF